MIFRCDKDTLLEKILIAHDIISSKATISILSNVLLSAVNNKLHIKATDLKVSFVSSIGAEIIKEGNTVVFCDRLLEILRSIPGGEIEFSLDDNFNLSILPEKIKTNFKLKCISADKFPPQPELIEDKFLSYSQKDFCEMISKTIFAISDDETRFYLNGVFLEKTDSYLNMVASDGKRLSLIKKEFTDNNDISISAIIPPKVLNIFKKNSSGEGNFSLAVTDKFIFIKSGDYLFTSTLLEGKFPNYQKIIPEQTDYKLLINRQQFEEAIKRVSILIENKTKSIYLSLKDNSLMISSDENEIGKAQEEINCKYSGPEITLVFNYSFLLEPLREIKEKEVEIDFNDAKKAVVLKPAGIDNYLNIILPLHTIE